MTARPALRLTELLATQDSSLALALAALVKIADEHGHAGFGALAIAYREAFLSAREHATGGAADTGTLSVDEARAHLSESVLPRLAGAT